MRFYDQKGPCEMAYSKIYARNRGKRLPLDCKIGSEYKIRKRTIATCKRVAFVTKRGEKSRETGELG